MTSDWAGIIFIIALVLWIYDACIYSAKITHVYFDGQVTHLTKTNTPQILDIYSY